MIWTRCEDSRVLRRRSVAAQHRHLFSPRSRVLDKCELFVRDTFDVLVEQEGLAAVEASLLPD